jgi:hypothetical protein
VVVAGGGVKLRVCGGVKEYKYGEDLFSLRRVQAFFYELGAPQESGVRRYLLVVNMTKFELTEFVATNTIAIHVQIHHTPILVTQ